VWKIEETHSEMVASTQFWQLYGVNVTCGEDNKNKTRFMKKKENEGKVRRA
jgi:hypothetical protein